MLIDEMIKYHIAVIVLLLGISIYGFFYLLGKEITGLKLKKRLTTRSYIIQGFLMAAGFSGLVVFATAKISTDLNIFIMIISYILLTIIETKKYFKISKAKNINEMKRIEIKYTIINTIIIILNFWRY